MKSLGLIVSQSAWLPCSSGGSSQRRRGFLLMCDGWGRHLAARIRGLLIVDGFQMGLGWIIHRVRGGSQVFCGHCGPLFLILVVRWETSNQ